MSHNFTCPASISPVERSDAKRLRFMAHMIHDQAQLEVLLAGADPAMREAMIDRLLPFLAFTPDIEPAADCQLCGRRCGSILSHECVL